jgi:hypothetical protein
VVEVIALQSFEQRDGAIQQKTVCLYLMFALCLINGIEQFARLGVNLVHCRVHGGVTISARTDAELGKLIYRLMEIGYQDHGPFRKSRFTFVANNLMPHDRRVCELVRVNKATLLRIMAHHAPAPSKVSTSCPPRWGQVMCAPHLPTQCVEIYDRGSTAYTLYPNVLTGIARKIYL